MTFSDGIRVYTTPFAKQDQNAACLTSRHRRSWLASALSCDQRAINREVLVRQRRFHLLMVEKLGHELLEHIAFLKAFPVLGEHGRVPDRIVRREADEPAKQQIVVELLHQLALGADRIEHLQEQCI